MAVFCRNFRMLESFFDVVLPMFTFTGRTIVGERSLCLQVTQKEPTVMVNGRYN